MTTTDLLPCPFCGGEAYIRRTIVNDDAMFVVFCMTCGASSAYYDENERAAAAWNQRVDTEAAMREKIIKEINDYDPSPYPSTPHRTGDDDES